MKPSVLIAHEKHGDRYLSALDETQLGAVALALLGKRLTAGYYQLFISALDRAFDILVAPGGATADSRTSFVSNHLDGCEEWRFCGHLSRGGKYRIRTNTVDCYPEDRTLERAALVERMNHLLATEAVG